MKVLRRPHLVLSHVGGHDRVAVLCQLIDPVDQVLRLDQLIGLLLIAQGVSGLPLSQLIPPRLAQFFLVAVHRRTQHVVQFLQHAFTITHDGHVHVNVLANRRRINIDMDDLGTRTELGHLPGHAIIKPGADGNHQVGIMDGHVGHVGAVHTEHPQGQRMLTGERAQGHQGLVHGDLGQLGQFANLRRCAGQLHAAADVDDGPARLHDGVGGLFDLPLAAFIGRVVAANRDRVRILEIDLVHGNVLGNVHQHGTGSAGGRDVERFLDGLRQVIHVLHQEIIFCTGAAEPDVISFLKGIVPDERSGDLAGKAHHGHGIHVGIGQRGDHVGHAGTRRNQGHSGFPRSFCIAFGHVAGCLLMPGQNDFDVFLLMQDVENFQDYPAGKSKNRFHSFALQGFHKNFGSCKLCHDLPHRFEPSMPNHA